MSQPDHILFLHIPKTAGSTLHTVIQRNYKASELYLYNGIRYPNHLFELPEQKRASIKVLKGHVPFGRHGQLSNGTFEYFTMLRDPVARVISHYNQLLRSKGHHFYEEWEKHQYTLEELMNNGKLIYLNDMMVRMISGKLYEPWDAIGEEEYQLALKNIDEHFFLAGVQYHFDAFLLMLCDHYHWKYPYYRKQQVARAAQKKAVVTEATIAAIREHNKYDQRLYELVRKKFEDRIAAGGEEFQKRLKRFQAINTRIEKILNALPFVPPPRGD
jgi:hypothetical protein